MTLAQIDKRLRFWQERLNLGHWEIDVELVDVVATGDEDAAAAVIRSDDYDKASIQVVREHIEGPDGARQLDISLCHELMHIHMRDLDVFVDGLLFRQSSQDAASALHPSWLHLREGLVDRTARIIVSSNS